MASDPTPAPALGALDPATRARLDDAKDWLRRDEEDPAYIHLGGDLEVLLAAIDAAVAERDAYAPVVAAARALAAAENYRDYQAARDAVIAAVAALPGGA